MAMNRILEFTPSQEEAVVSRILVLVHQAVDEHFPSAAHANRQFTKTVFSDDSETTAPGKSPADSEAAAFATDEVTFPGGIPSNNEGGVGHAIPPPPMAANRPQGRQMTPASPPPPPKNMPPPALGKSLDSPNAPATGDGPLSFNSQLNPLHSAIESRHAPTQAPAGQAGFAGQPGQDKSPDWTTRITLALLIAGLVLLTYVLLF